MTNTIRDDQKFRVIYPYEEMKPLFGRNIYPQDIDGEVEKSGHFLWLEWKRFTPDYKGGQWLANFKRVWLLGRYATLMVITHGDSDDGVITTDKVHWVQVIRRDKWLEGHCDAIRISNWFSGGWQDLRKLLLEWSKMADERPNSFVTWVRRQGIAKEVVVNLKATRL